MPRAGGVPTRLVESNERGAGATWGRRRYDRIRDDVGSVSSRCRRRTRERADAAGRGEGRASLRMAVVSRGQRTVLFTIVPIDASAAPKMAWLDLDSLETQVLRLNGSASALRCDGPSNLRRWANSDGRAVRSRRAHDARSARRDSGRHDGDGGGQRRGRARGIGDRHVGLHRARHVQQREMMSLAWVDREGREEPLPLQPGGFVYPRVSPDGTRIAVDLTVMGNRDVWIWDVRRSSLARLTDGPSEDMLALWTPDSRRVFFSSDRAGNIDVYSQPADGSTQARVSSRLRTRSSRTPSLPMRPPLSPARISMISASSLLGAPRRSLC